MMDYVAMWNGRRVDEMSKEELIAALSHLARQRDAERQMARQELETIVALRAAARKAVA